MKLLKFATALLFTIVLVGCGRVQPILQVENTPVVHELQKDQVRSAIILSAQERGWIISEAKSGLLKASIVVRSHSAEVEIPYSAKYYSILYVNSDNLKASDGKIHRNYNRWVNNLNVDIQRNLAKVATK